MSFNLDDPLAGILSDDSEDSFFDDDILGKKKTKKKDISTLEKKNALFDLEQPAKSKSSTNHDHKIEESIVNHGGKDEIIPGTSATPSKHGNKYDSPTPFKRSFSKESIKVSSAGINKEISSNIDIGKSVAKVKLVDKIKAETKTQLKPTDKAKSSQSLLDDILGESSSKTGISNQLLKTSSTTKSQELDLESILGKADSRQAVVSNKNVLPKSTGTEDKIKKEVSTTSKTKTRQDWLGIFEAKENKDEVENDTSMPTWLTGGNPRKKKADVKEKKNDNEEIAKGESRTDVYENAIKQDSKPHLEANCSQLTKAFSSANIVSSSNNENLAAEGAALFLQQQEYQLAVALQLKAQEEKLAAMQMRQKDNQRVQKEAEQAQHSHLEAMLRRQAEHRSQMQAIIAGHQERITKRIKDLLIGGNNVEDDDSDPVQALENSSAAQKESPHAKEKRQLLQLVQSLQENHEKEIDLMETSYRRQLAFLEVSSNQAEERMKEESDKLVKFYTEKINWLEEHHHMYKKITEENMTSLTEHHKSESEAVRRQHSESVKILQEHHTALIENIKNAVKQEHNLITDSSSFSSSLLQLVSDVKESRSQCQQLVEKINTLTETTQYATEKSLQTREMQVKEMIQQLKSERENFEKEKTESRDVVKMLETRLKQMTTMIEEESTSLKQKKMEFEFEKATFGKQTEFAKNVLKKQDEEIRILREDIQKEYQEKIAKIDEEKSKAIKDSAVTAKEKASVQTVKQELEKMKTELHAQLEQVTEERTKLNLEKQQIQIEEQRIIAKSRDLELLAKSAIEQQSQADRKYSEAELLQRKFEDRLRRIQEHVVSLNAREKQIAREKVALSRERLSLHNKKKQIETSQQCSLCRSTQNVPYVDATYAIPESYVHIPVSRDYGGNMNAAVSTIEQEMIRLVGKNLSNKTVLENEGRFHENYIVESLPLQDMQVETVSFKDYMDPKFMMMRLDVQQVISNLDQKKKNDEEEVERERNHIL